MKASVECGNIYPIGDRVETSTLKILYPELFKYYISADFKYTIVQIIPKNAQNHEEIAQLYSELQNKKSVLKENTTLSYPEQFTGDKRIVKLKGEAFFDVAKNPHKAFVIQTKATTTKVLGTSFKLSA